jgi:flagellar hook-associated protein 1 FlgK
MGAGPAPLPQTSDPARGIYVVDPAVPASVTAVNTALGLAISFSPPVPPSTVQEVTVANGGSAVRSLAILRMGTTATPPALPPASGAWPLFVDSSASDPHGGVHPLGVDVAGLAQRLQLGRAVTDDSRRLNGAGAASGDPTRATALLDALVRTPRTFSPETAIGGAASAYRGPVADFARRVVETQGADAEAAKRLDEGQRIALAAIESRFAEASGVNIDQEMAQLVQLQTAYGANARVMSAVRDMLDMLMRM